MRPQLNLLPPTVAQSHFHEINVLFVVAYASAMLLPRQPRASHARDARRGAPTLSFPPYPSEKPRWHRPSPRIIDGARLGPKRGLKPYFLRIFRNLRRLWTLFPR